MKVGLIDFRDSFTLNIADYLRQLGAEVDVIAHDTVDTDRLDVFSIYDGIVLSPGPKSPRDIPHILDMIRYLETHQIPTLGICLGHQAIGAYYGHEIRPSAYPVHGMAVEIMIDTDSIFKNIQQPFYAMRYNSLTVKESLHSRLKILARDIHGDVMAIRHEELPIYGLQFHPESIGTPTGKTILANWLEMIR